jgi:4-hydroxy-tetrahydrodipicolinate synthase
LKGTAEQSFEQVARFGEVGLPIMLQDAPLSGIELTIPLLTKMARKIEILNLLKIESVGTAAKLDTLLAAAGDHIDGP